MKVDHRFVFWVGVGLLTVAAIYVFVGASPPQPMTLAALTGSDGRCTGFPNGFGRWDWSTCCQVHDAEGVAGAASDGRFATCLLENTPLAASPLVFLACAVMTACRPIYNVLQRWSWVK